MRKPFSKFRHRKIVPETDLGAQHQLVHAHAETAASRGSKLIAPRPKPPRRPQRGAILIVHKGDHFFSEIGALHGSLLAARHAVHLGRRGGGFQARLVPPSDPPPVPSPRTRPLATVSFDCATTLGLRAAAPRGAPSAAHALPRAR